jgi:hypothetical protein
MTGSRRAGDGFETWDYGVLTWANAAAAADMRVFGMTRRPEPIRQAPSRPLTRDPGNPAAAEDWKRRSSMDNRFELASWLAP